MRVSFRAKLFAIAAVATGALAVLAMISLISTRRVDEHLTVLREQYLPLVELRPTLEAQLERLSRSMQDAVAASDVESLRHLDDLKAAFYEQLDTAQTAVPPAEAAALSDVLEAYVAAGRDVSKRLIAKEAGEGLVESMTAMQEKRRRVVEQLATVTALDRAQLAEAFATAAREQQTTTRTHLLVSLLCFVSVILLSWWITRGVVRTVTTLNAGFHRFGDNDFSQRIPIVSRDELGNVAAQANSMAARLEMFRDQRDRHDWVKAGAAGLATELQGELEPAEVANRAARFLGQLLKAPAGAVYVFDRSQVLRLQGHYAVPLGALPPHFVRGEGLLGQAALRTDVVLINDPPDHYFRIDSALGSAAPRALVLVPLVMASRVVGVLELALFTACSPLEKELLTETRELVAVALQVAQARVETRTLLHETQAQASRLSVQEEELRAANEELQEQQKELRRTNEELSAQTEELEAQRRTLQTQNTELDQTRKRLEQKAVELTSMSAYKSQFLTNMSHELRTPLNSMLLLSNLLSENEAQNLTPKQVEFSKTIHSAGKDLLALINQVLDLAKVESGKQDIHPQVVRLSDVADRARRVFEPVAADRHLAFRVVVDEGLPQSLTSDPQRVDQIITNLLGNAFKFTERGEVRFHIRRAAPGVVFARPELRSMSVVAFEVSDTGPGIAAVHRERIFAPFEQLEGASDRRYGGTGLGLSIARELTRLLGGELQLESTVGVGSTFCCYLPEQSPAAATSLQGAPAARIEAADDGTDVLHDGEPYLLIIEDDRAFATAFGSLIHEQGLRYQLATTGQTGLLLAARHKPAGVILDVKLPDLDGFSVLGAMRSQPTLADVPVHFVSAVKDETRGLAMGAVGYLTKPASKAELLGVIEALVPSPPTRDIRLLVVEDDVNLGESLMRQLAGEHLTARRVTQAHEALAALEAERYQCVVLDLSLPDMDGLELLEAIRARHGAETPSIVIYSARALTRSEVTRLEAHTEAIVIKEGASNERLLTEIRLFVRRLREGLPLRRPTALPVPPNVRLEGKKILIVDDDMRTVYALSATMRGKGAEVFVADTGHAALEVLTQHPDIDAVLMDIMMPEMDGYEAMRRIRQRPELRAVFIVALTAKAMKGDDAKCLEAGANAYLPKPVDSAKVLELLHLRLRGQALP